MPSNANENRSLERTQKENNRSNEENYERTIDNQQERAIKESSKILNDNFGTTKGFLSNLNKIPWAKNKRIPRLFYINNERSILVIMQGDITRTKVDAIVNAANERMTGGGGVDGIVHSAAGDELYEACKAHKQVYPSVRLPTGHSRILLSYNMSRTTYHIINTAGPVYNRRAIEDCAEKLSSCYKTSLALADLYDLESIGFTAISCGIFGYPVDDGARIALETVDKEAKSVPVVVFVLWDDHIYDAWIKTAEQLKLSPYDPECAATANSYKATIHDNQKTTTNTPKINNNEQESATTYNPVVRDHSTPNITDQTPQDISQPLMQSLPSVPGESLDTQPIEDMEQDNNPTSSTHRSNTAEMTDINLEGKPTTGDKEIDNVDNKMTTINDGAVRKSAEGETETVDDKRPTINDESQSRSIEENSDEHDDKKVKIQTVTDNRKDQD